MLTPRTENYAMLPQSEPKSSMVQLTPISSLILSLAETEYLITMICRIFFPMHGNQFLGVRPPLT